MTWWLSKWYNIDIKVEDDDMTMQYLPEYPCRGCESLIPCETCKAIENYRSELAAIEHFVEYLRDEPVYHKTILNKNGGCRIISVKTGIKKEFVDHVLEEIKWAKRR